MSGTIKSIGLASFEMSVSINRAQRAFNELLKTCLGHYGLTIPKWSILGRLHTNGATRPTELAAFLGVKPPFTAKILSILEGDGLVTSTRFDDDERGKMVVLTTAGRELVESVEIKLEACLNGQLGDIDQADLKTFFTLNNYIARKVRHH